MVHGRRMLKAVSVWRGSPQLRQHLVERKRQRPYFINAFKHGNDLVQIYGVMLSHFLGSHPDGLEGIAGCKLTAMFPGNTIMQIAIRISSRRDIPRFIKTRANPKAY